MQDGDEAFAEEGPEERAVREKVAADIARVGWHVALVPPDETTPGWAHTIGLLERFGHPELVVFGSDPQVLGPLLNALGARVREGARLEPETEVEGVVRGLALAVRAVAPRWVQPFLGNAAWHCRRPELPALQVFWPDARGRFPWEPGCDPAWRDDQPYLAASAVQDALPEPWIEALRRDGAL